MPILGSSAIDIAPLSPRGLPISFPIVHLPSIFSIFLMLGAHLTAALCIAIDESVKFTATKSHASAYYKND